MKHANCWIIALFYFTEVLQNNPLLLYSTKTDIRISNTTHNRYTKIKTTIIVQNLTHGTSLDYHYEQKKICWTDHDQETIQCIQYNGVGAENKVSKTDVSLL